MRSMETVPAPEPAEAFIVHVNNTVMSLAFKVPKNREYLDDYSVQFIAADHTISLNKQISELLIVDDVSVLIQTSLIEELAWTYLHRRAQERFRRFR